MIISVPPKRLLKTLIFEKKGKISSEKILGYFSRILECDKPQGTFNNGPKDILPNTVEVTRFFL